MEPDNTYRPPEADVSQTRPTRRSDEEVGSAVIDELNGTRPWVLLSATVLILSTFLIVIGGLMIAGSMFAMGGGEGAAGAILILIFYGLMGVIYLFLGWYLIKYAIAIGQLSRSADEVDLVDSLSAQRKFWRLVGILTLIAIVMFVLSMFLGFAGAIFQSMR